MRSRLKTVYLKNYFESPLTENDLKFEDHTNSICGKASAKIIALSEIVTYIKDLPKRKF